MTTSFRLKPPGIISLCSMLKWHQQVNDWIMFLMIASKCLWIALNFAVFCLKQRHFNFTFTSPTGIIWTDSWFKLTAEYLPSYPSVVNNWTMLIIESDSLCLFTEKLISSGLSSTTWKKYFSLWRFKQILEATPNKTAAVRSLSSYHIFKKRQKNKTCRTHCWKTKDKLINHVFLWTPIHEHINVGQPAGTY